MNDPFGCRALQSVSVYVGHDVVANDLLAFFGFVVVDIIGGGLQFCDLLVSDGKARAPVPFLPVRSQSFLQVLNFISGEKRYFISLLGYRSERELV